MPLVVATQRDDLRAEVLGPIRAEGLVASSVASWSAACGALCDPATRLLLVDPTLPDLDPALLAGLAAALPHRPAVRVLGADLPPLGRVPRTPRSLGALARRVSGRGGLTPDERAGLRWFGLGGDALTRLGDAAAASGPVLLLGERGTGKERLARLLHRLAWAGRHEALPPFVPLPAGTRWERPAGPGTLYLEAVQRRDPAEIRALVRDASTLRWRIVGGTRATEAPHGADWRVLSLTPLRERPSDLAALFQHYVEQHATLRGLPPRRVDRSLVAALLTWRWPGNQRELEDFAAAVVDELPGPLLRAEDLSPGLRARLRPPTEATAGHVGGFVELAEARLGPVVRSYAPGGDDTLYDLVMEATERILVSLVLARTGGNRKAAAALLGIARNTLHARILRLKLEVSPE